MFSYGENSMKKFVYLLLPLFALFLTGCQSNKYEEYYSILADNDYLRVDEPAKLIELAEASQISKLQATGDYILIGTSSFYDLWVPRTFALNCAKKHGACLVVLSYQKGETKEGSVTMNVPTSQTTYHHGTVYGSYGNYANFHGSSTTYGSTPVTINYQNTYYQQTAYFFGKRKNKNSYGVYFQLPENIPGNTDKKIRVSIVVANSQAAQRGIKPGDVVTSINRKSIKTNEDVIPFMNGTEKIESIEVKHE